MQLLVEPETIFEHTKMSVSQELDSTLSVCKIDSEHTTAIVNIKETGDDVCQNEDNENNSVEYNENSNTNLNNRINEISNLNPEAEIKKQSNGFLDSDSFTEISNLNRLVLTNDLNDYNNSLLKQKYNEIENTPLESIETVIKPQEIIQFENFESNLEFRKQDNINSLGSESNITEKSEYVNSLHAPNEITLKINDNIINDKCDSKLVIENNDENVKNNIVTTVKYSFNDNSSDTENLKSALDDEVKSTSSDNFIKDTAEVTENLQNIQTIQSEVIETKNGVFTAEEDKYLEKNGEQCSALLNEKIDISDCEKSTDTSNTTHDPLQTLLGNITNDKTPETCEENSTVTNDLIINNDHTHILNNVDHQNIMTTEESKKESVYCKFSDESHINSLEKKSDGTNDDSTINETILSTSHLNDSAYSTNVDSSLKASNYNHQKKADSYQVSDELKKIVAEDLHTIDNIIKSLSAKSNNENEHTKEIINENPLKQDEPKRLEDALTTGELQLDNTEKDLKILKDIIESNCDSEPTISKLEIPAGGNDIICRDNINNADSSDSAKSNTLVSIETIAVDTIKQLDINITRNEEAVLNSPTKEVNPVIISTYKNNLADSINIKTNDVTNKPVIKHEISIPKSYSTLDILTDDEDEILKETSDETPHEISKISNDDLTPKEKKSLVNIDDDDDDIMLIDEDSVKTGDVKTQDEIKPQDKKETNIADLDSIEELKVADKPDDVKSEIQTSKTHDFEKLITDNQKILEKPLVKPDFLESCLKNLTNMTRDRLEEFCIMKIVESIVDRCNLNEIKRKLKSMSQAIEEHKKKAALLTKQNRDLQVVLKSVQEEQKKGHGSITPLKITRSVGMQVVMAATNAQRKRMAQSQKNTNNSNNPVPAKSQNQPVASKTAKNSAQNNQMNIPVPRLVPAANFTTKTTSSNAPAAANAQNKKTSPVPTPTKTSNSPKLTEKRPHSAIESVTVDLTDDEPPAKVTPRNNMAAVRLVPSQNLMALPRTPSINSSRKVFIPISSPQNQNVPPNQTMVLKSIPAPRQRGPAPNSMRMTSPQNAVRAPRPPAPSRHPAPLPDALKQYQHPNFKNLPPAPDLKLSKVENGIVISWKIEGYLHDSYEEIASYQLYAYQETSAAPSTALWKKIGDVKALPLPMACTLTQFMAGYKYYFAVRAVDIRSRYGPFSLPGSILLLNKM